MTEGNQKDLIQKRQEFTKDSVSDSAAFSYVHKKLERLSTAVYKVTDFMDISEPIRTKLRTSCTDLLVYISRTYAEGDKEKRSALRYSMNEISSIISLCEVSKSIGLVSEMNFSVLKEEFTSLIDFIERNWGGSASTQNIKQIVEISEIKQTTEIPRIEEDRFYSDKRHLSRTEPLKRTPDTQSTRPIDKKDNSGSMSNRQEKIISFVRKNGASSIKDIASVIEGCSDKTVQRDLAALVSKGVLNKEGERRWSRYSIA